LDHQSAIDRNLTERYLLEELDSAETAAFEEHFFECPLCAEDVGRGSLMVANLKAVLREENAAIPVIEIGPEHKFLELTIGLKAEDSAVECEIQCGELVAPLIVAASILGGVVHLHLPARLLSAGPCTVILRNQSSRSELERRQFVISKMA
jgi:Putative zinc-finger